MRSMLAPATALMRRLKYPEKFALVGSLFIIPLLVVFVLLMREVHHTRAIAERELGGTRYLRALHGLLGHLQQHRGLAAAVAGGAAPCATSVRRPSSSSTTPSSVSESSTSSSAPSWRRGGAGSRSNANGWR
jgi:hypothetical protein